MKAFRSLTLAAVTLLGLSCAKEPAFEPIADDQNLIPLNIAGSINQVPTRATAQGFVDGDGVGLYAVNYLEDNTIAGVLAATGNQADNVKYVFDEANYKWVPVKPVYYKDINTHVDLYLYYPYEGTIQDVNAANFEVKKDQSTEATATELSGYEASDWMWGKATDITPSQSSVQIPLNHKLSAIKVTLGEGSGWDTDEFDAVSKGVIVTNTTRKATLDYATGAVTPVGSPQLDGIVMCPQTDGTFRAVVIPQTVAAGNSLFSITVNGVSYSFSQNNPVTYQQGKMLNVTITINKKTPTGDYELELAESQIVPWTEDLNTHGGEARQYYVVNVETPGTLGDVITADGKNPTKIRNLKLTGIVNASDFYFMRDQMTILKSVNMKECTVVPIAQSIRCSVNSVDSEFRYKPMFGEPTYNQDTTCGWDIEISMIPDRAFEGKMSLTNFVFPDGITMIGYSAFSRTSLSGSLILPDNLLEISSFAFQGSLVSSVSFPSSLISIGGSAFRECTSLSGSLLFPASVVYLGQAAFYRCRGLSGMTLHLPDNLGYLGDDAFHDIGTIVGNLVIPERIKELGSSTFANTSFTGTLDLRNVQKIKSYCFYMGGFSGQLIIPEGVNDIPEHSFAFCNFSSITIPSSVIRIRDFAFWNDESIVDPIVFPEGLIEIGANAFSDCHNIPSISLPSSLQTIQNQAFYHNYNISSIVCEAAEPPSVGSSAFDGVAKDNFTVEVPSQSVTRYQTEIGWSDFKRIAAHYDFSLSRKQMRALNGTRSKTFVLRAPADFTWRIQEKPEWVTVEPSSGTGKTDVTITIAEMARTDDSFEVNEGQYNNPYYERYKGRIGQVVFKLDDKDYTFVFDVEQYDYDYPDGHVQSLQTATHGPGIDIVFTGDGYDARDIAKGTFLANAEAGFDHMFDLEPYKTYKDYGIVG